MRFKTPAQKAMFFTGVAGLGMIVLGGVMFWRQRRSEGVAGLGHGRLRQAPMINSYSDGNMRTTLRASSEMPIEERIATIQDLIHKSTQDPQMRKLALQATAMCPERDQLCEAEAVYHFVKNRVRYTGDVGPIIHPDGNVEGIDLYQSARRTLEFGGGDCDDQAVLNATLLALNGIESKLRVVKQRKDPDWSHIYAVAVINGKAVPLDTTLPGNKAFNYEMPVQKMVDFPA